MHNIDIQQRLGQIQERIQKTRLEAPLAAPETKVIAVTKQQSLDTIKAALELGLLEFGENRVQEAKEKWGEIRVTRPDIKLHLIGPLQTNKIEDALELFDVIHTLDREKLAMALKDKWHLARGTQLFIQVNTGEEPQKSGIAPKDASAFIDFCMKELKLPVTGLMCIPPAEETPAAHFGFLHELAKKHQLAHLSMGMSGDYDIAVRYGATYLRIGTALLGERFIKT